MRKSSPFRLAGILGIASGGALLFAFFAPLVGQWLGTSLSLMDKVALAVIGIGAVLVMSSASNDGGGDWLDSDSGGDGGD